MLAAAQRHRLEAHLGAPPPQASPVLLAGAGELVQVNRAVLLEHGVGQTYCLAPGTRVLRGDLRWVPIEDLRLEDELIAFDEDRAQGRQGRAWRPATVTGLRTITQPCYRLLLADGTKLVASADHRWLKRNRQTYDWARTADLQEATRYPNRASKVLRLFDVWDHDRSWGAGYLAAAFDGEGCLTQTFREERGANRMALAFTQKENAMLARVTAELDARRFAYTVSEINEQGVRHLNVRGGVREVMRFLGAMRPERLLAKFVPPEHSAIRGEPIEVLEREFLGDQTVIAVETSTGTLIAEGFASHNSGVSHSSWAGGEGRDNVVLFVCPNERVARANAARYPTIPNAIVGSPHLEVLRNRTPYRLVEQRIAISCHWESAVCPETRSGFAHFEAAYEKACRQSPGSFVLHGHPRHQEYTAWKAREWGVEFEPDFAKVTDRAWCYVTDNSSTLYEWAALDRPVVTVSPPWYRREVEHGLRFWEFADVGVEVYDPAELDDAILFALADLRPQRLRRGEISRYLFGDDLSYGAASRAASAIVEVL